MGENTKVKISYEDEVQDVLKESAIVEEKVTKLVNRFYVEHDKADIFSIIDLIYEKGNPKNREFLDEFKLKYDKGDLTLKEIARYNDLYDQHRTLLLKAREGNYV